MKLSSSLHDTYDILYQKNVFLSLGPPGKRGEPGPKGAEGLKGDSGGVVYTRWGRKDCPKSGKTTMLYSGITGFQILHVTYIFVMVK